MTINEFTTKLVESLTKTLILKLRFIPDLFLYGVFLKQTLRILGINNFDK